MNLPLKGLTVLEFSQYLAGPYAGLRLADLGARVIKIERPGAGDACRKLATKNLFVDGDSLVFHTINRNKESYAANLKDANDLDKVRALIAQADVMTHNFRPGVMEKIGLDYEKVKAINPRIVYGDVTGYGKEGSLKNKPGQDLLAQSISGITWLTGDADDPPVPFGLAAADMLCGTHLAQGILAALVQRGKTGIGSHVEVNLLESLIDVQFEVLTAYLNDGKKLPQRAVEDNAHAYLSAPYGIYETNDGHIAIAMGSLERLGELIGCSKLSMQVANSDDAFDKRDELKAILSRHLKTRSTDDWLAILEPADYWCSDVFNYARLMNHDGYKAVAMEQSVQREGAPSIRTLRCPIRIDGERIYNDAAAPVLGNDNFEIETAFNLAGNA
ncbi:CaiB/BaiF CoA-transferase family protein [Rubellicoccus peritrichatus]|uniref:CaiB/BaiF CoA-transferase family protein n=1 Tax=Rubellicoccus peritrichatus TaxID=3080537 RepID=A0AAQ3LC57_9BACT|nr:CaiB/BaiF CoA-transferase family protein [Puniceicoccus sp. CR14]WOO42701.1 CaiB/BaiF CoA-transferase family protein [Puniceicoccus sp. CR14]